MAAPKGNRFWEARSSHGRKPIFASPEQLWEACCQYFKWVEDHPLWEMKAFAFQGVVTQEALPKMRAMTLGGLCIYLDIDQITWGEYSKRKDFTRVCEDVRQVIRDQKFTGAAADLLNAAIIARDLGLVDKQEHTGADGAPLMAPDLSDPKVLDDVARRLAFVLSGVKKD